MEQDSASQAVRAREYEPELGADGTLRLGNYRFHRLVQDHRRLVCHMNLSLLEGLKRASHTVGLATSQIGPSSGPCAANPVSQMTTLTGPPTLLGYPGTSPSALIHR
jgi:hypothetical protein